MFVGYETPVRGRSRSEDSERLFAVVLVDLDKYIKISLLSNVYLYYFCLFYVLIAKTSLK